jgi:hypothetical protein
MGASNSKVQCLYLPAQSGKTRKIQDLIRKYDEIVSDFDDDCDDGYFNILLCSNNSLLVKQTVSRMEKELYDEKKLTIHNDDNKDNEIINIDDNQTVYCWLSNIKDDRDYKSLATDIIINDLQMLVCCSHSIRMKDHLYPLICQLNKAYQKGRLSRKINIWIDEADASISLWSKYEDILGFSVVNEVTLVSATIDTIIKQYQSVNIIPVER